MADDKPFFESKRDPDFERIEDDAGGERTMLQPHMVVEDGVLRTVYPSHGIMYGWVSDDSGNVLPSIRIDCALYPTSLVFLPTPIELRAGAKAMLEAADKMEAAAAGQLAQFLKRGKPE